MQEANLAFIGDAWMEYALTGKVPGPHGNGHATFAPHGIFPCRGIAAGRPLPQPQAYGQRWVAIAAESDAQFAALADVAGRPDWTRRYPDTDARRSEALAAEISAWTRTRDRDELAARLAAAGVAAAPVLDALEVAEDPVFRGRGNVVLVDHPEAGVWPQAAVPCILSRTPARVTAPAPLKGAHSQAVLERLLGMSRADYQRLQAAGVTGVEPHS